MGVLEENKIITNNYLTKDQLFYELVYNYTVDKYLRVYNLVSESLRMPKIEYEPSTKAEIYDVKYIETLYGKESLKSLASLRELVENSSSESENKFKRKFERGPVSSLESLDYLLTDMYRKKLISYDSKCKLLRDMALIVALDYVYGVGTRSVDNVNLYHKYVCDQSNYRLLGVKGNFAFCSKTTKFPVINSNGNSISFLSSIMSFSDRINFKDFTNYFQNNLEKIISIIDDETFVKILQSVKEMYPKDFINYDSYYIERSFFEQRANKLQYRKLDIYR